MIEKSTTSVNFKVHRKSMHNAPMPHPILHGHLRRFTRKQQFFIRSFNTVFGNLSFHYYSWLPVQ